MRRPDQGSGLSLPLRERDPNEISARNRRDLALLNHLFEGSDVLPSLKKAATTLRDISANGGKAPLEQWLDLDIWRINLFIPGEYSTETTQVTAISGVVVQQDNMRAIIHREGARCEDPADYGPRPSYYILFFKPADAPDPYYYTGLDPEETLGLPSLSTILGVDKKRLEIDSAEYNYRHAMVTQDLIDYVVAGGEHEVGKWPDISIPREITGVQSAEQVAAISRLFGEFQISKRKRFSKRTTTEIGPFKSDSRIISHQTLGTLASNVGAISNILLSKRTPELNP